MLDLQMHIFKAVAEAKSFSLAAQKLHMTQSSVSQHIQNLEAYYGVKLFDRLRRKITLTQAGAVLYPYAVELEQLFQKTRAAIENLTGDVGGRIHIGASFTIGEYVMPAILAEFSCMYPQVSIAMDVYNTEKIVAMVTNGEANIGFVEGPYEASETLLFEKFSGDRLVIIAPPNFQNERSYLLSEILKKNWVMREKTSGTRRVFEEFLVAKKYDLNSLNIIMELGSTQAVKEAVKAGLGVTAISCLAVEEDVKRDDVRIVEMSDADMKRPFTMLVRKDKFQTLAVIKLKEFVIEQTSHMAYRPSALCRRRFGCLPVILKEECCRE